jgi:signal transduction histidine kinase
MASTGPGIRAAVPEPRGLPPGGPVAAAARAALRAPFTARTRRELLFCLAAALLGLAGLLALPGVPVAAATVANAIWSSGHPAAVHPVFTGAVFVALVLLVLLVVLAPRAGRGFGALQRALAAGLLGEPIPPPPARAPAARAGRDSRARGARGARGARSARARPAALLSDGPGWRAVAYVLLKLPILVAECYAVFTAVFGVVNMTYPFWWHLFRNHPPSVRLQPAVALTPFGALPVATFPGTFAALAAGAAMLLAAPWVARAAAAADCWLMRGLLGPGRLAQRIFDLEQTRSLAVQDAATLLRRLERDLHDGAQVRLATLALDLGMAREKLDGDADPQVRELVDAAHRGAKDALIELRNLARGLHPPALDNGLADALATLAAGSALPAELTTDIRQRPAPAIETIAYFCAAELLANAAKHSRANKITITVTASGETMMLRVSDDGCGGADPAGGSGLSGLVQRVSVVDGQLEIRSPPGGPTQVTAVLPMRA